MDARPSHKDPTKPQPAKGWSFAAGSTSTLWNQICSLDRKLEEDCKLDFVEPIRNSEGKPVAQIPKSEILAK